MKRRADMKPFFAGLSFLFLTACAAPQAAPVHNLGTRVDSAAGAGVVMVREGDTVFGISERYRLPLRDIIDLNGLKPPYHLKAAQRLQLPPPNEHKTATGDTVTGIARLYGVPASQIVSLNKLSAPYQLDVGQVLRIPSGVNRTALAAVAPASVKTQAAQTAPRTVNENTASAADARTASPAANTQRAQQDQVVGASSKPAAAAPVRSTSAAGKAAPVIAADITPSRAGFIWPVRGKVISSYGPKAGHLHNDGINIAAPRGAAVMAAADGSVAYVGNALSSYGNLVLIRHDSGLVTAYAHLDRVHVARGAKVKRGQAIGSVGSTGTVATPQLHFEVRKGIESLDPARYLGA